MADNNYMLYAAGEFITSDKVLEVNNPYNNTVVAKTYLADSVILNTAIEKAQSVQNTLKNLPAHKKFQILKQISEAITTDRERLAEVLALESGKPLKYALAEIDRSAQTFLVAAEECKRLPKEYISLDWTPNGENREGLVKYFPIGLVAGIAPFNFPLNLAVHKIAPAIASGCPIILKPASSTPLSCLELAKIIDKTELPKGAVSILPMDRENGNLLVTDDRFKLVSFTGSPEVGWKIKNQSGKKKVVLELGGNAACILTASTNLNDAMPKCLTGAFAYSGQICIHAQRFIVHESIFKNFTEQLKTETLKLKSGNPIEATTDVSSMIDEANAIRVETWINEAIQQGATLVCGAKRTGCYVEPTILINCNNTMKVYSEEVFGPVVCINSYTTIAEAVELVNNSKFGLQCGVFTDSINELNTCYNNIEVGGVIHNHVPTLRYDHMPYGGIKESGLGREGIKYAIMDMMEPKILVK